MSSRGKWLKLRLLSGLVDSLRWRRSCCSNGSTCRSKRWRRHDACAGRGRQTAAYHRQKHQNSFRAKSCSRWPTTAGRRFRPVLPSTACKGRSVSAAGRKIRLPPMRCSSRPRAAPASRPTGRPVPRVRRHAGIRLEPARSAGKRRLTGRSRGPLSLVARDPAGHGLLCRCQGKRIVIVSGTPAQMGAAAGALLARAGQTNSPAHALPRRRRPTRCDRASGSSTAWPRSTGARGRTCRRGFSPSATRWPRRPASRARDARLANLVPRTVPLQRRGPARPGHRGRPRAARPRARLHARHRPPGRRRGRRSSCPQGATPG